MSRKGELLKGLAFQRDPEDYQDVLYYLAILQERERRKEPLDSGDQEAMDIAQAYLQEVGITDYLMSCIKRKDVEAIKKVLDELSRKLVFGSGLNPEENQAKEMAKKFVIRMQKSGKQSSLKGRKNATFLA
jgi:hypothetical protein